MKLIAKGWQYKVFDIGNDRVRKIERSDVDQYTSVLLQIMLGKKKLGLLDAYRELKRLRKMNRDSISYIKCILHLVRASTLGNPLFVGRANYEQDKVKILDACLADCDPEEQRKIIEQYISLILWTWEYGFSDCTFNFTVNNGLNKNGELVQIDFGELVFSKDEVRNLIANRRWLQSWSYKTLKDAELKKYYCSRIPENITLSRLDDLWRKNLKGMEEAKEPTDSLSCGDAH